MKIKRSTLFDLFFAALAAVSVVAIALIFVPRVHAADTAPIVVATDTASFADTIAAFIVGQASAHPWLVTLATVIGILRIVFKPIVTGIEAYVKSTPQTTDDEFVAKAQHSPAFKTFAWLLDFFGSVKIGPQFTATPKDPAA